MQHILLHNENANSQDFKWSFIVDSRHIYLSLKFSSESIFNVHFSWRLKFFIFLKNLSILDRFAVSHLFLFNISWKGLNKSFIVCLICRQCSSFSYFSAKSPYFYLVGTFGWNGLLLLFSRLIPGFPNSRFFLEPMNRELRGTTVVQDPY